MSGPDGSGSSDPLAGEWLGQHLENLDWRGGWSPRFSSCQSRLAGLKVSQRQVGSAELADTEWIACQLDRVHWQNLKMRAGQWHQCDCREMAAPGAWIRGWQAQTCLFQNADFSRACFHDSTFFNCELSGSQWKNALLLRVRFGNDNYLGRPDLRRTDFSGALIFDADLAEADFSHADLKNALFVRSNLYGAHLDDAQAGQAVFLNCRGRNA